MPYEITPPGQDTIKINSEFFINGNWEVNSIYFPKRSDGTGRTQIIRYGSTSNDNYEMNITEETIYDEAPMGVENTEVLNGAGNPIKKSINSRFSKEVVINYDGQGRMVRQSRPYESSFGSGSPSKWTTFTYDALGRVKEIKHPDNQVVKNEYNGTITTVTDEVGRKKQVETDALGRTIKVVEQNPTTGILDLITTYAYDILDNVLQANVGGQIRSYEYDSLSRITKETTPEGGIEKYTYTDFGGVETKTDARGVITTYVYDELNRLKTTTYSSATGVSTVGSVSIGYDTTQGQVKLITDNLGSETYLYDPITARMTSKTKVIDGKSYKIEYEYTGMDQVKTLKYPSGRKTQTGYNETMQEVNLYEVNTVGAYKEYVSSVERNASEQITRISMGHNISLIEEYTYDPDRGYLTGEKVIKERTGEEYLNFTYEYNAGAGDLGVGTSAGSTGQLMTITGTINTEAKNQGFKYDNVGRLISATGDGWSRKYGYDRWANQTGVWDSLVGGTQLQNIVIQQSAGVPTNKVTSVNGKAYSYDLSGNVINDGATAFTYDSEGRIATSGTTTYGYDTSNRRIKKVEGTTITHYIWDGSHLIAEYDGTTGALKAEYVYLGNRLIAKESGGITKYYHSDRTSMRVITDGKTGAVVGTQDQLPYGELSKTTGEAAPNKFTSYWRDGATDYAINRQYYPATGRFNRPDPVRGSIFSPQSLNRYSYASNDPVNLVDPLGLFEGSPGGVDWGWGGGIFGGGSGGGPKFLPLLPAEEGGGGGSGTGIGSQYTSKSSCAKTVDDLVTRASFPLGAGHMLRNITRHTRGRSMAYEAKNGLSHNSKNLPIDGFRTELINNNQLGDVYKHIYGHAGVILVGSSDTYLFYGRTGYEESDYQMQLDFDQLRDPGHHFEAETELRDDKAGRSVGYLMRAKFDGTIDDDILRKKLFDILCSK